MIKTLILHHLPDMNDLPAVERWYYRFHIPEVLRSSSTLTRYVCYRSVPSPPGAENFGYMNYKVHENLRPILNKDAFMGFLSMTPEVAPLEVIMVNVPEKPTEDFMGSQRSLNDKTILRWMTVFRYPEGVSAKEGDDWYLNVHAKEVQQQPGLTRFFSYRTLSENTSKDQSTTPPEVKDFLHPKSKCSFNWHRVSEQWYENSNGWEDSIVKNRQKYTPPPWANYKKYPFFEPSVDFFSTFILEHPTNNWLRDTSPFYI